MNVIYINASVAVDGPVPGFNSMLSIGAAAFRAGSSIPVSRFEMNLAPLPGANPDPETLAQWAKQPQMSWEYVTRAPHDPIDVLTQFTEWVRQLGGTPTLVGGSTLDLMWIHYYLARFVGAANPFKGGSLDIKSVAFALQTRLDPLEGEGVLSSALRSGTWLMNQLISN